MTPEEKECPQAAPKQEQPSSPAHKGKRDRSVLVYLVALFAVAFLLLLMAFFMQQRSNENTISTLRDSVAAMQAMEDLRLENQELRASVEQLKQENQQLTEENQSLREQLDSLEEAIRQAADPSPSPTAETGD